MTGPRINGLTARQIEVLQFIQNSIAAGAPPTRKEIAAHFGFSQNAAQDHLNRLEDNGRIKLAAGSARNIRLLEQDPSRFDDANVWSQFARVVFLMNCSR